MKKAFLLLALLLFIIACTPENNQITTNIPDTDITKEEVDQMKIESNDFEDGSTIPAKFSCDGKDINPHLSWQDAPDEAKSFALIIEDPDAPGGTFVHWMVYDISADKKEIKQDSVPGKQVQNDFGKEDYG